MSTTTTPDLTLLTITHRAMRHDAQRLHRAVAVMREDDRPARGPELERWFHGFEGEVLAHHAFEDRILLPQLVKRAPTAFVQVARVDQDHKALADALQACAYALSELADPGVAWVSARGWALAATSALAEIVVEHLDFTDLVIVPAFAHFFDARTYAALETDAKAFRSVRQAAFSIPWILTAVPAHEQTELLETAPRLVRMVWRLTRARYGRLVQGAFGSPELAPVG